MIKIILILLTCSLSPAFGNQCAEDISDLEISEDSYLYQTRLACQDFITYTKNCELENYKTKLKDHQKKHIDCKLVIARILKTKKNQEIPDANNKKTNIDDLIEFSLSN
ncbi:MAG: hypothetical protein Q7U04_07040 [Bacteriovorax sp.]|nr:hypothetical protein [Bacteriovorax sp.]